MPRRRWTILALTALLTLGVFAPLATACPTCSDNLSNSDPKAAGLPDNPSGGSSPQLAEGFYYSILLMLGVPVLLLGSGSFAAYRAIKKARIAKPAAGHPARRS